MDGPAIGLHRPVPAAVDGVEFQQMRGAVDAAIGFVHMDEAKPVARPAGPKRQASHAAEAVDAYPQSHAIPRPVGAVYFKGRIMLHHRRVNGPAAL